jgi:hypothetical protein
MKRVQTKIDHKLDFSTENNTQALAYIVVILGSLGAIII